MQTFLKHESADGVYCACVSPSSMCLTSVEHASFYFHVTTSSAPHVLNSQAQNSLSLNTSLTFITEVH